MDNKVKALYDIVEEKYKKGNFTLAETIDYINKYYENNSEINEKIWEDLWKEIAKEYPRALDYALVKIQKNKEVLLALLEKDETQLQTNLLFNKLREEPEFVKKVLEVNFDCVNYIGVGLKNDPDFVTEIIKNYPQSDNLVLNVCDNIVMQEDGTLKNKYPIEEVKKEIESGVYNLLEQNESLQSNSEIMQMYVQKDATAIKYASEELKNNFEFIKQVSRQNKEVVSYAVEHTDDFGEQGLEAVKEVGIQNSYNEGIEWFKNELARLQEEPEVNEAEIARAKKNLAILEKYKDDPKRQERMVRFFAAKKDNKLNDEFKGKVSQYSTVEGAIERKREIRENVEKEEEEKALEVQIPEGCIIDEVAELIMKAKGKGNIVKAVFNGFNIISSKYEKTEDIVEAYNKYYEEKNNVKVREVNFAEGTTINQAAELIMKAKEKGNIVKTTIDGFEIYSADYDNVEGIIDAYNEFQKKNNEKVTEKVAGREHTRETH